MFDAHALDWRQLPFGAGSRHAAEHPTVTRKCRLPSPGREYSCSAVLTGSFDGIWWLPDQPDRRVAGTLEVGWGLLRLDLIGSFLDPPQWSQVQHHPVILGTTTDGKRVTLHENLVAAISFNLAAYGLPAVTIRPTVAFVGGHLTQPVGG